MPLLYSPVADTNLRTGSSHYDCCAHNWIESASYFPLEKKKKGKVDLEEMTVRR